MVLIRKPTCARCYSASPTIPSTALRNFCLGTSPQAYRPKSNPQPRSLSGIRNHNLDLIVRAALSSAKSEAGTPALPHLFASNARKALFAAYAWLFPLASLRHLPGSPGAEQLEQIVGETYQFPFRSHLLQSAQQEPSEPTPLFDLPEHRFHDRLAHPVQLPSRFRFQLLFHLLQQPSFCV